MTSDQPVVEQPERVPDSLDLPERPDEVSDLKQDSILHSIAEETESRGPRPVLPSTFDEAMRLAQAFAESNLWAKSVGQYSENPDGTPTPEGRRATAALFVRIQYGAELEITPVKSLGVIFVVNGIPSVMGNAALAILRARGALAEGTRPILAIEKRADDLVATITTRPRGSKTEISTEFSWTEAKRAKLDKKDTYQGYPRDMLTWRAVSRHVKQHYAEFLLGLELVDVARDIAPHSPLTAPIKEPAQSPDPLLVDE